MRKVGIKNLPFDNVVLSIGALCMIELTGCCANVLYADGSGDAGIVEFLGGSTVHNSVAANTSCSPCKMRR